MRLLCRCDRNDNNKTKTFGKNLHTSSSSRMHVINHNFLSHETASSSAECSRDKKPFSFVRGQDSTMWNIVWVLPQGHRSMSVSRHFLLQAPQCPRSMQKRFSRDHCCWGRLKPGCRIVGSHTRWELTICVLKCIYYTFQASSEAFSAPVTLTCGFSLKFCYSWGFPSSVWKKMTWTFLALPWQANHTHTMKFVNSFARSQHLYDTVATLIHVDSILCHILLSCCLVPVPVGWCLTALSAQKRLYHAMGE